MAIQIKGCTVTTNSKIYTFSDKQAAQGFADCLTEGKSTQECKLTFKPIRVESESSNDLGM